jgi:hypothetical protein
MHPKTKYLFICGQSKSMQALALMDHHLYRRNRNHSADLGGCIYLVICWTRAYGVSRTMCLFD